MRTTQKTQGHSNVSRSARDEVRPYRSKNITNDSSDSYSYCFNKVLYFSFVLRHEGAPDVEIASLEAGSRLMS